MSEAPEISRAARPPRSGPRRDSVEALIDAGAIAVVRLPDVSRGEPLVHALLSGGVRAIEITLTTVGALELITVLAKQFGDALLLGAGSVLTVAATRQAIDAGARYIVSPVFDADVMTEAHAGGAPMLPGAFTPTEIRRAHDAGADLVKVFPADTIGPAYLKSVLAPMPFLELVPTGGVTPHNAGQWITAGAVAVGLGSALVDPELVHSGDFATITERAHIVTAGITAARRNRGAP
ncbi:MAG: bifunctional 4-hydroxy-2-oxoglutarate aldolase/2-dehydro-3-deoxy-phosphogluconate aldolase [Gemmatimonadaceae bacterium]|nr:bifunctional 4-hydroxy-2-oxoglutarate aldolase/2-dehydro-3-deoxy-phosphogluconate aldolase [Gemmatimonadaceae bacterium]